MIIASHWGWWIVGVPTTLESQYHVIFHTFFRTFGQVGVIIFILLSGYFLCTSKFKIISLLKLLEQVFFYVVFLLLFYYLQGYINSGVAPTLGISAITDWFTPISSGRWWFFSCYVALYLISPFLNRLIERLKKHEFRLLLCVLFLFVSIFPSFFVLTTANDAMQNMIIFIFVYFIGAYIRLYQEDFQSKSLCLFDAVLSLVIFVIGKKIGFIEYRYFLYVIILSVFIFLTFMHLKIQSRVINKCAKSTFGVYLLHDNAVVTFWLWNDVFAIQNFANTPWFIPVSILSVIVTFIVCALIDYIRQLCFEPILMSFLNRNKINKVLIHIDSRMPINSVKAEENTQSDNKPIYLLLFINALYLLCKLIAIYLNKNITYKLFLVIFIAGIFAINRIENKGEEC